MSQKAFNIIDKDFVDTKAAIQRLLKKRRSLMEEVVKDLTPRESFDMRLEQLLHEHPDWTAEEEGDANFSTRSTIYIENCAYCVLDLLKDPRYNLSCDSVECESQDHDMITWKRYAILNLAFDKDGNEKEE